MSTDNQGAIFIASFSEQLIREKVMMPEPDINDYQIQVKSQVDLYDEYVKKYEKHLASRRTFPYDVKEGQDGKELREGIDFEIETILRDGVEHKKVAIPIEPEKPEQNYTVEKKLKELLQNYNAMDHALSEYGKGALYILKTLEKHLEPDTPLQPIGHIKELPEVGILDAEINSLVHGTRVYSPNVLQQYFWRAIDAIQNQFSLLSPTPLQPVKDEGSFADYIRNARNSFVTKYLSMYPEPKQRILAEDLLTAYDKMRERLSEPSSKEQEGYWKKRCEAAEDIMYVLNVKHVPIDILEEKLKKWKEIEKSQP